MAALDKGGSRTGSISLEPNHEGANSQTHLLANNNNHHNNININNNGDADHNSLATLARRSTIRKRSIRNKKMLELQDVPSRHPSQESLTGGDAAHLHPGHAYTNGHRRSPSLRHNGSPLARSPSPRRRGHQYIHHDIGFSDTVSNVVEMVKETRHPRHSYGHPTRYPRGGSHVQHSYPVLAARRGGAGRRLPPTPCKPSTLQLKPANINFPKLNASPTHTHHSTPHSVHSLPHHRDLLRDPRDVYYSSRERDRDRERYRDRMREYDLRYEYRDRERELYERERDRERELERERLEYIAPLSFEQALAMGRTGRVLPSPVLNGYKPKGGLHTRHSDSDEEDWC